MKACFLLLSFIVFFNAEAQAEVRDVGTITGPMYMSTKASRFELYSIRIADVPSRVEESQACLDSSDSTINCTRVLRREKVVSINLRYDDGSRWEDSSMSEYVNLPLSAFTASEIAQIRAAKFGGIDLSGKKFKRNQRLTNELVRIVAVKVPVQYPVYKCVEERGAWTENPICVKQVQTGVEHSTLLKVEIVRK